MTPSPAQSNVLQKLARCCLDPFRREKDRIRAEILSFQGLMPLLMQQRNGRRWTPDERGQLARHLRRLRSLSPYLLALAAPGSIFLLPLLAWWLDRRSKKRNESSRPTSHDERTMEQVPGDRGGKEQAGRLLP